MSMGAEQKALEIVKVLAKHIQDADEAGVQAIMYVDALYGDDEKTLGDAILACAGIGSEPQREGVTVDRALKDLVSYLTTSRPRDEVEVFGIYSVGEKMAKINCGEAVHCFVAVTNFTNKALGVVKQGQIFMPASWKAPAKHARGDLFDINTWHKCFRYM